MVCRAINYLKEHFAPNTVFTSQIINMYLTIMHPSSSKLLLASSVTVSELSLTSNSVNYTILLYLGHFCFCFLSHSTITCQSHLFSNQPSLAPTTTNHYYAMWIFVMHLKIEKMYDSQCIVPCVYVIMLISNLEISRPWSSPKPACEFYHLAYRIAYIHWANVSWMKHALLVQRLETIDCKWPLMA